MKSVVSLPSNSARMWLCCGLVIALYGLQASAELAFADNVTLLTSYNLTYGASQAYSEDSVTYEITVHVEPDAVPGDYTLTAINTFAFNVDDKGNIWPTSGGPTKRVSASVVTFEATDTTDMDSFVDSPRPPEGGYNDPHFYGDIVNTYFFTLYDTHSQLWWYDTELITNQFFWQTWYGYYVNPTEYSTIGADTNYWRQPQSRTVNLDVYLGSHPDMSPPPCSGGCGSGSCPNPHMAGYSFDLLRGTLRVTDTPVSYSPPVGPGISFTTSYNQANLGQLADSPFGSLGPNWTYSWLTYIVGGPDVGSTPATRYVPGGGLEYYQNFQVAPGDQYGVYNSTTQVYSFNQSSAPERTSQAVLSWNASSPGQYTRSLPDGSYEIYGKLVTYNGTNYYLITQRADAQGNVITFGYDSNNRLSTVTDAIGQVTTLYYASALTTRIDHVTDPFGRTAQFTYDSQGRLQSSKDPQGIVSTYGYDSTNFLNSLTTPYGTTTFSTDRDTNHQGIQATNPLGQTERAELRYNSVSGISDSESSTPSVSGMLLTNSGLSSNNTYYWDRRQYTNPPVYSNAVVTHWMNSPRGLTGVIDSQKKPLEGRVWYNYSGQSAADTVDDNVINQATITARVLDSGTTQASLASFTAQGLITQSVDPIGRTTNYSYDSNGIDLYQVTQADGTGQDLLSTMTYDTQHDPLTITDASQQTKTLTYNAQGQPLTSTVVVGGSNQTTTMAYNGSGYLTSVTGPISGATTSYTYDSAGRVHTVTDSEGYVITNAYDNLDRQTSTTYPDGTSDQTLYDDPGHPLNVAHTIDRQGRVTSNQYDAIRELIQTTDPLGRVTKYGWCTCGGLATLADANNNVTTWNHDLQGRVTSKVYADTSQITYTYESTTSRLHSMTDARGNVATYTYNADNTLAGTAYSLGSGVAATPNVSFSYDTVYNRVTSMTDGTGSTTYSYNPITGSVTTGAGRLASVASPIAGTGSSATVAYSYDELGRVVSRTIDGGSTVGTTFDALGRVTNVSNPLGAFTYGYVDETSRLSSVTYPSSTGLSTSYAYFNNVGDQRLQDITNSTGTAVMSKFDYTYNPVGTIATWTQQTDTNTPTQYALSYDAADQLIDAEQTNTSTGTLVTSNKYGYDPAGNRLNATCDSGTFTGLFNGLNQLTSLTSTGTLQTVSGYTSGTITGATVNAVPATISNSTNFSANVPLVPSSTNVISVVATPSGTTTGTVTTQRWSVVTGGTAPTRLNYDAGGNTTTDEKGNTYTWDALNRLTQITYSSGASTLFAYDGLSRRVQIIEKNSSGSVTSTKNYLWIGSEIAEERDTSNTVQKRFFPQGEQQSGTNYYYTRDHLGSVREMLNGSGSIVARYDYDPYGKTTLISGSNLATMQYAGMYVHQVSGLNLTRYRAYDPNTGRWLSRDPIAENGGMNLYGYVDNDPEDFNDPDGLRVYVPPQTIPPATRILPLIVRGGPWAVAAALAAYDAYGLYQINSINQATAALKAQNDAEEAARKKLSCKIVAVIADMHNFVVIYLCNDGTWYRVITCVPGNVGDKDPNPPSPHRRLPGPPVIPEPDPPAPPRRGI